VRLSLWTRIAIVVATLAVGAVALKVVPGPVTERIKWLEANRFASAEPQWDFPTDGAAIRAARAYVRPTDSFYVWEVSDPNAWPAALLYLTPAWETVDPAKATWILSYDAPTLLPPGVHGSEVHELGPRIFLVRAVRR
jgi:hypothetical protein